SDTSIGGVALFVGKVRDHKDGETLSELVLEHYPGMTEAELERIEAEAQRRFELSASLIVHRVGPLKPGDNIVLVIACAAHRQNAFAAAEFLMDYLKTRAPFWKKEVLASGKGHWVDARESDDRAAANWETPRR
ncbi:MAG: molybdenum cofactor biosynthesis protein MoaE, partial [Hyphomicrobium sp.]|uniref:molybdenum cofactor biosynthesis protein MoaE n=1 Tax=Hyphomicrobium sp. TaxID=82 RepID=UPI00356148D5